MFHPEILPDHRDYTATGLDYLYNSEKAHPWFRHRVDVIRKAFATHVKKTDDILEVGAGTGHTARALLADGFERVSIGEIHKNGLLYAKTYGLGNLYQFDLRSAPFRDHFDVVGLFDVLEHIEDDRLALENIHGMLRPGGRVILTVPAHRWLWSRIDELSGHHRRYTRQSLATLLASEGFALAGARYFFTALVPGLLVRSFLSRKTESETLASDCGLHVSRTGNLLIGLAARWGDILLAPMRRFVGGSLLAVARKV